MIRRQHHITFALNFDCCVSVFSHQRCTTQSSLCPEAEALWSFCSSPLIASCVSAIAMSRPPFVNPLATGSNRLPQPASDDPFDVENRTRRPVSDEGRARTIGFLQRLSKEGLVRDTRKYENDKIKERCFFSCSQTLQGQCIGWSPPLASES